MRIVTIFKAVTKNWIRSRSGLFFSVLFPVLLLLVFGAIFSNIGASGTTSIFIQNQDVTQPGSQPTDLSTAYITALNDTGFFDIKTVPPDANATDFARSMLGPLGGTIRILIVSQGFQQDLINGTLKVRVSITFSSLNETYYSLNITDPNFEQGLLLIQQYNESLPYTRTSLTMMLDPSDQSASIVRSVITSIGNAFNYQLIGAENVIEYDETTVTTTRLSNVDYYVPGITAAFIMTNGIIALTATTTDFKRRGIIKRLAITPLKKIDWILGNVLSQTLLNFMLTGIMIAVGWILFNVRIIPDAYTIALIFLGSIMFSGIGMILSGLIKDVEAASAIGNAIAFPMMFLSGSYFPLDFTPSYIQAISRVLPLTYFADGLRYAMLYKYPEGIFTNMAIVGVLAVAFIAVGSIVTRWKEK
jgi:ABC-2 type transport system permease protein